MTDVWLLLNLLSGEIPPIEHYMNLCQTNSRQLSEDDFNKMQTPFNPKYKSHICVLQLSNKFTCQNSKKCDVMKLLEDYEKELLKLGSKIFAGTKL